MRELTAGGTVETRTVPEARCSGRRAGEAPGSHRQVWTRAGGRRGKFAGARSGLRGAGRGRSQRRRAGGWHLAHPHVVPQTPPGLEEAPDLGLGGCRESLGAFQGSSPGTRSARCECEAPEGQGPACCPDTARR